MAFGLFSIIILLLIGTAVLVETVRGVRRGFVPALLGLATVFLSVVGGLLVAGAVSTLLAEPLALHIADRLAERIEAFDQYRTQLPRLNELLGVVMRMLIGPLLFLPSFLLLRLLFRLLISALSSAYALPTPDAPRRGRLVSPGSIPPVDYESESDSPFRRYDRSLGGIVGVLTGLSVAVCLLSPLTGMLKLTGTVYDGLNDIGVKWRSLNISQEKLERYLVPFTDDAVVYTVGCIGGQFLYDSASTTELDGRAVTLQDEVAACMRIADDTNRVIKILGARGESIDEARKESLRTLGDRLDDSRILCVVASDFLRGASERWLTGRTYFTVRRPACGRMVDPLMDELLIFLYEYADPDFVGMDVDTMLGIYLIALDHGLLNDPDTATLLSMLEDGTVLDEIHAELARNPRMAYLVEDLTDLTMEMMAQAIGSVGLIPDEYDAFMGDLAEAVTLVNGMSGADFETQVNTMTDYAVHYAKQYGVELPSSVAQMGVSAMMEQFSGQETVTEQEMKAYIDHFLNREGSSS